MDAQDECTSTCKSRQHGDELSAIVATASLTDEEVLSYCCYRCRNYCWLRNSAGQTLCHVAAAAGRLQLLRHLLHLRDCLNDADAESGYTPLHTSVWHGEVHCAVRLIEMGSKKETLDNEFLTPLDIAMKDRIPPDRSQSEELYVWGSNNSYNLGCGHDRERTLPEHHDFFQKAKIPIKQVVLEKFHSVFVALDGSAWTCGLAGRAGIATDNAVVEPRRIPFSPNTQIVRCAAGEQHTLFLTSEGVAFSAGLNTHAVLGHSQRPVQLPTPKALRGLPPITGICSSQYHSVFYNSKQLFTCGTNHGQLGHPASELEVIVPKEVTMINMRADIEQVAASVGATVMLNSAGAVYLLSGHRCTRITPRDWLQLGKSISVIGGPVTGGDPSIDVELKILLLTSHHLFLWRDSTKVMLLCTYSLSRQLYVQDIAITNTGCIFTTYDNEAFIAFFKDGKKNKTYETLDVRRLPHIHRGRTVAADARGRNFAVLQSSPTPSRIRSRSLGLQEPQELPSMQENFQLLLDETTMDDNIHDVVFKVGGRSFYAHRYIVFYGNDNLSMKKLLADIKEEGRVPDDDGVLDVILNDVPSDGFHSVLRFVYSGRLFLKSSMDSEGEIDITRHADRRKDVQIKHLTETRLAARKLGVASVQQLLDGKNVKCARSLNRKSGAYDVSLVADDGTVIRAHKCVLVARLEFFRVMLTHGWRESDQLQLKVPVTGRVLEILVDFLYTDGTSDVESSTDIDFLSLLLMSADGLLCEGLKQCTANRLQDLLTLRNAPDLLQLASTFNAPSLQSCAQIFILVNLSHFLEARSLEILPDERLEELSKAYKLWLPHRRRVRSSLDNMEVAIVRSLAEAFPSALITDLEVAKSTTPKQQAKKKRERKTSERQRLSESMEEPKITPKRVEPPILHTPPPSPSPSKDLTVISPPECNTATSPSLVQRRLKVITESKNIEPSQDAFTSLTKKSDQISLQHFPELQSQRSDKGLQIRPSSTHTAELPKKFTKLSQRERRRLASASSNDGDSPSPVKPVSPWATIPPLQNTPTTPTSSIQNKSSETVMSAIINAELADRERLSRMRSKPLALTQLEDRALRELELFYNVAAATDEYITVRRLNEQAATAPPVWPIARR